MLFLHAARAALLFALVTSWISTVSADVAVKYTTSGLVLETSAETEAEETTTGEEASCESETCEVAPSDKQPCDTKPCDAAAADKPAATTENVRTYPTHKQIKIISVHTEELSEGSLQTFCLTAAGDLLAACSNGDSGDVRRFSPTGEWIGSWDVPFAPEAINVGSEGRVYLAGGGKLARYTLEGELVNEGDHPSAASMRGRRDEIREEVLESHENQREWMTEYVEEAQTRVKMLTAIIATEKENAEEPETETVENATEEGIAEEEVEDDLTEEAEEEDPFITGLLNQSEQLPSEQRLQMLESMLENFEQQVERFEDQVGEEELTEEQIEQRIDSSIAYKMKVASISEADGEVFFATGAAKGYGFSVWRTNRQFEQGEQIVERLSGCCGQMDVQACEAGLYVAENSRHQVRSFDRYGEERGSWGSQGREGLAGFGSCCNPMNVAFGPEASVYTAESGTGRIKRFTPEGKLIELVGKVDIVPGCKKVSIAVGPGGDRVYMLDITRDHIVLMERLAEGEKTDYYEQEGGNADTAGDAQASGSTSFFGSLLKVVANALGD